MKIEFIQDWGVFFLRVLQVLATLDAVLMGDSVSDLRVALGTEIAFDLDGEVKVGGLVVLTAVVGEEKDILVGVVSVGVRD